MIALLTTPVDFASAERNAVWEIRRNAWMAKHRLHIDTESLPEYFNRLELIDLVNDGGRTSLVNC